MKAFEEAKMEPEGFTLADAELVVRVYVCSQCEGGLSIIPSEWDADRYSVVCPDCGNIEQIGRISKTTVAIRNERGVYDYYRVIRVLPEFWGELIPTKEQSKQAMRELGF